VIRLPDPVRNKAVALDLSWWLDDLDSIVAGLAHDWGFTAGRAYPDATEALVLEVLLLDETPAVLKVMIPRRDMIDLEVEFLRLVDGEGGPVLFEADEQRGAILMERLGDSMADLGLDLDERLVVLANCAQRVWRPAPAHFPSGAEEAQRLITYIERAWEGLGMPCSRQSVDHAITCARSRLAAHDDSDSVLVHGDVHQWNALRRGEEYVLVDPDGLRAEPEYDLGVLMREDPVELLEGDPYDRARLLADLTGTNPVAIWEWGAVERVSTGLLCTSIGLQPVGSQMLETAEAIAG
jgi:streptomycin 6-kinase